MLGCKWKPPRQFARRGQALARREVVAQNAEHDLRDQLFADRDFAAAGKPELHGANIISGWTLANKVVTALSPAHCRFSIPGSMMKRMSFSETIFLFFLALIIFGPKKLPEIARYVGKTLNEFRRASNEFKAQIEQEIAQSRGREAADHSAAQPDSRRHGQPHAECRAQRNFPGSSYPSRGGPA